MSNDAGTPHFSFARLVTFSLGAGTLVLLISIPIILVLARWTPIAGLVGALVAVLVMIGVIGVVSRRIISAAERDILAAQAETATTTDRNTASDG
ncbi:hypothetical protein AAFP30_03970 [Gordonia sp. CPCC 205515]|uniref:hypothetical protein n=1 Tax=Gordonia sp. CPCC 205515 TaxID=3140791 RepID=UPI003AF3A847